VQREGEKVSVKVAESDAEYFGELKALIDSHKEKDGLTAIICRNTYSLEKIRAGLGKSCPTVIEENDSLPKQGVFMIELALAKGLEFDSVIIADGDDVSYPDDELGKHCLYTAVSRATKKLSVLAKEKPAKALTSFLP
jgi:DNA helicase-2/ATP-dependent DNA helicase PcrA